MNDDPSVSRTIHELRRILARHIGNGTDSDAWTAGILTLLDETINAAYVGEYLRPANGYRWTFLKPLKRVVTVSGENRLDLPRHFAGIEGRLTYASGQGQTGEVTLVGEGALRSLQSDESATATGAPCHAAIRPMQPSSVTSQVYELVLWPTPDAAYTLEYRQVCGAFALSDDNPVPLGGSEHWELLVEAVLKIADERTKDEPNGIHAQKYAERLAAAIAMDSTVMRPESLGYTGDPGDYGSSRPVRRTTVEYA